jgi:hypothetical protein
VGHQQRRHQGVSHPYSDAEARHARLRDLEDRLPDQIAIADADLVIGEALDGEVLAELAIGEVVPPEFALPIAVGLDLVHEHGTALAAVRCAVRLVIAVDVDPSDHRWPLHRLLPDRGAHRLALPFDVARESNVDGEQSSDDRAPTDALRRRLPTASRGVPVPAALVV